jgi:hypothetical protein
MTPYECTYCMECHWDMCHDTTAQAHAVKNTSHVFQTTWKTYGNLCDATKHVCHVFHVHMCVKGGHGMSKKTRTVCCWRFQAITCRTTNHKIMLHRQTTHIVKGPQSPQYWSLSWGWGSRCLSSSWPISASVAVSVSLS